MKKVYVYVLITAFLFGTMEVSLKVAGGGMDSFQLTFLRFAIGGILILPLAVAEVKKNKTKIKGKDLVWLLLLGIVCIPVSMLFFQLGVERSNAATAAVLFCINPLFTMVIAHFFAGERMNKQKGVAFIIGLLGIIFMIRPWEIQEGNTILGMGFTLFASLTFSIYTVMGKKSIEKLGIMVQTGISFIFGSVVLLVIILAMDKPVMEGVSDNLLLVAYIGIFVTGLGYWCFFQAIKYSDASTGSVAFFIKPAIAPVIAVVILHEQLLWNTLLGIALILVASYINLRENRNEQLNGTRNTGYIQS
ncbi:MAG: DMT family transporter [Anaerovoracaceae bacterium]